MSVGGKLSLFKSFFMGGFECSTHYTRQGKRLDQLAATQHDRFAASDYARLREYGILTVREGIRWFRIETTPGHYDFTDALPLIRAAEAAGIQVIWDLMHFGYPDDLDPYSATFITRFAAFAREFTHVLKSETDATPFITPINEISFLAFQGSEIGTINPFSLNCGDVLKAQLVRATIEGMEAIRAIAPDARFVLTDPLFNAVADTESLHDKECARAYSYARYEVWDLLAGDLHPELGGARKYLDIIGLDYYPWNQWIYVNDLESGATLTRDDPRYIPLHRLLIEVYERYQRPLLITETSTENDARAEWLAYVSEQARLALQAGVPLEGICLYPIVNFPGWENERACENGLWGVCDQDGARPIYEPLARELIRQTALVQEAVGSPLSLERLAGQTDYGKTTPENRSQCLPLTKSLNDLMFRAG